MAAWLYAGCDQFVFRVSDVARSKASSEGLALSGLAAVGELSLAAADFSRHGGRSENLARIPGSAGRGDRQDRRENPERRPRDSVGLRQRGAGRLWLGRRLFEGGSDRTQRCAVPR